MSRTKTNKISPQLVYECPLMKAYFFNPREYCKECVYLVGFHKNGWGESVLFDDVGCLYDNSEEIRTKEAKCA